MVGEKNRKTAQLRSVIEPTRRLIFHTNMHPAGRRPCTPVPPSVSRA